MNDVAALGLDAILAKLRELAPAMKAEGVTRLAVFGSRARGDARPDSDLDILVDVEPDASFSVLDLIGIQHLIDDATGLQTQATMRRSISPRIAERIADDIVEVF
jgi:predicted nucleotidyltransferase